MYIDHGNFINKVDALFMLEKMNKNDKEFYIPFNTSKIVRNELMNSLLKSYQEKHNPK